jgi:predicted ATPase
MKEAALQLHTEQQNMPGTSNIRRKEGRKEQMKSFIGDADSSNPFNKTLKRLPDGKICVLLWLTAMSAAKLKLKLPLCFFQLSTMP